MNQLTNEQARLVQVAKSLPQDHLEQDHVNWNKVSKATKEWLEQG